MTPDTLRRATGCSQLHADKYAEPLTEAMSRFAIDNPKRQAAFLAQLAHESGRLAFAFELWGPTDSQRRYERDPKAAWPTSPEEARTPAFWTNRLAYTLGNTQPGDGLRFRGHGLIQITGRSNHAEVRPGLILAGYDCVPDVIDEPNRLALEPRWAAASAGLFWHSHALNKYADSGDFSTLTRRINGGLNGYEDRVALHERAMGVFA